MESRTNTQLNEKIEAFLKVETEHGYHDGNIETSFGLGRGKAVGSGSYATSDFVHYDCFGYGNGHYINEIYNYYLNIQKIPDNSS